MDFIIGIVIAIGFIILLRIVFVCGKEKGKEEYYGYLNHICNLFKEDKSTYNLLCNLSCGVEVIEAREIWREDRTVVIYP